MKPQPSAPVVLPWLLFATGTVIVKSLLKSILSLYSNAPLVPVLGLKFVLNAVSLSSLGNSSLYVLWIISPYSLKLPVPFLVTVSCAAALNAVDELLTFVVLALLLTERNVALGCAFSLLAVSLSASLKAIFLISSLDKFEISFGNTFSISAFSASVTSDLLYKSLATVSTT